MFNSKFHDGGTDAANSAVRATPAATNARTFAAHAAASDTNCSIINEWLIMRGDLESQGDILVKGKVQGNIQCKMLIIDAEAVIEGAIFADDIVIRGTTRGIIQARRVRIEKSANIDSEIYHETFSAEEGARVKGSMRSFDEYGAENAGAASHAEKDAPGGASLYQLLDKARSAHVAAAR